MFTIHLGFGAQAIICISTLDFMQNGTTQDLRNNSLRLPGIPGMGLFSQLFRVKIKGTLILIK
jgi:hypothetical protein